jgi:general secretion pathway protein H
MDSCKHRRMSGQSGFTLLEMISVLIILALATAIALPRLRHENPATALRRGAVGLASEFRLARAEAIRTSTFRSVTVDVAHRKYWMGDEAGARTLPSALEVAVQGAGPGAPFGDRATVSFESDGSSSGGEIFLKAGPSKANVVVDWMTGATQVEWMF